MRQKIKIIKILAIAIAVAIMLQTTFQYAVAKTAANVGSIVNGSVSKKIKTKAHNFTLRDVNGKEVSLASLKGKTVLLNFWATWCPYCVREMPALQNLHRKYGKKGLVILTINVEDTQTAKEFLRAKGFTFKAVVDAENIVSDLYGVEVLPTTFIINRDGDIVNKLEGGHTEKELLAFLKDAGFGRVK